MNKPEPIGLGLIGCGSFGQFCLETFSRLREVRIVAVADASEELASAAGRRFGVPSFTDSQSLLKIAGISLVHIATPPATHRELVMAALAAGKNVLCEKPLATQVPDGVGMLAAAREAGKILPVNFVLRYNVVTDAVRAVLRSGALGEVLAAWLTNCATDSNLAANHWFWDPAASGGIFVEHGVHFFDLYRHWLGDGELVDARAWLRPGTAQQDRVECIVRHGQTLVHHYHGFDQVAPMDRTEHRILCELGDIRVQGWIPLTMTVDAALDAEGLEALKATCFKDANQSMAGPAFSFDCDEAVPAWQADCSGRGKPRRLVRRLRMNFTPEPDKSAVYRQSTAALLADQIAFIRDRQHVRRVTESDGLAALELAAKARAAAEKKEEGRSLR